MGLQINKNMGDPCKLGFPGGSVGTDFLRKQVCLIAEPKQACLAMKPQNRSKVHAPRAIKQWWHEAHILPRSSVS